MSNFYLSKNEALDSTQHWKENSEKSWVDCLQDLIKKRPFGDHKFYVFMFVKHVDDKKGVKKMFMYPRLTKPEPLPGTTIMQVDPNNPSEALIIWTLPSEISEEAFKKGKHFSDPFVHECVRDYIYNPRKLMKKEEGELSEEKMREIYRAKKKGNLSTKTSNIQNIREGYD